MKTLHELFAELAAELSGIFARFHAHPAVQAAVAAQAAAEPPAPVVTAAPPAAVPAPAAAPAVSTAVVGLLGGQPTGNDSAQTEASMALARETIVDPYGDHNGSVFPFGGPNDGGGFLWFGQGTKAMTLQGIVAGKMVSLSMADLGGAASLTVKAPSGADVPEAAFSGTDYRDWTAAESGDYTATVVSESTRGSLRLTRHS